MQTKFITLGLFSLFAIIMLLLEGALTHSAIATPLGYDTGWMELCTFNCDFELGNMSGWTESGGTFDVNGVDPHSGSYAVNGTSATTPYLARNTSVSQCSIWIDGNTPKTALMSIGCSAHTINS
jgi:hypothetical protein